MIFGAPLICEEEEREILGSLRTGWLGTGPKVAQLEREFRDYKGAQYAVAVNSCAAALHLSMLAAGIGAGDEVITTALTFCATVNPIITRDQEHDDRRGGMILTTEEKHADRNPCSPRDEQGIQ